MVSKQYLRWLSQRLPVACEPFNHLTILFIPVVPRHLQLIERNVIQRHRTVCSVDQGQNAYSENVPCSPEKCKQDRSKILRMPSEVLRKGRTVHWAVQRSPPSQPSASSTTPSPQNAMRQSMRQAPGASSELRSPSSHSSPVSATPSPQTVSFSQ